MPAINVENPLTLPRLARPSPTGSVARTVELVVSAHQQVEGAGFRIWRVGNPIEPVQRSRAVGHRLAS